MSFHGVLQRECLYPKKIIMQLLGEGVKKREWRWREGGKGGDWENSLRSAKVQYCVITLF